MSPEITRLIEEFTSELTDAIQAATLANIQQALSNAMPTGRRRPGRPAGSTAAATAARTNGRRRNLSPEAAKKRKLQGQYLGALRRFKGAERSKYQKIARTDGVAAALKAMGV